MFLRLWDLKVSGKKAELVARVFAASENNVPLKKTAEVESDRRDKYQAKLLINSDLLPDPNLLTSGWLNEDDGGIYSWPCILYVDLWPSGLRCRTRDSTVVSSNPALGHHVLRWPLNANFHRLSRSRCYFVVLRCRWFRTKAASACPLLETIDRVYPWRFTG